MIMEPIYFPNIKLEVMTEKACQEIADWIEKYTDDGVDTLSLVGILEVYKTALTYNLLEDVDD